MNLHIITLFPEICQVYLSTSMMGRAAERGHVQYHIHNLADYSVRPTRRVDDRPYGGGAGTVIAVEPLYRAIRTIMDGTDRPMRIIIPTAEGTLFSQDFAEKFAKTTKDAILVAGHYEGFDERIFSCLPDIEKVSLGKYVLTGGELPCLIIADAVVRLLPGVLSSESLHEESYSESLGDMCEYPQYTRPREFLGESVPDVLMSGDHAAIAEWRRQNLR